MCPVLSRKFDEEIHRIICGFKYVILWRVVLNRETERYNGHERSR